MSKNVKLIKPYGGSLVELIASPEEVLILKEQAVTAETLVLSERSLCDLEMLAIGAFSPLKTFMGQRDYESVLETMRLIDGTLFPVPVTLPADTLYKAGQELALRDSFGNFLALLTVTESYIWDPVVYAEAMFGTYDEAHPIVKESKTWGKYNVSGILRVVALPQRKDFNSLRLTPKEVRKELEELGNEHVVAFQTRNPLHRAHEELTKRAANQINGTLLLHPSVGMTKPGDVDHITRVRCYTTLIENYYQGDKVLLSLLPLAMRMAGPREAMWHAIIRRNYGADHFIVGRDHAGPGETSEGKPFYGLYDAQKLVKAHEEELGIKVIAFNEMLYLPDEDRYVEANEVPAGKKTASISGTQVREEYLAKGRPLPEWFTRPEVATILNDTYGSGQKGFCIWLTGFSGAGKSTIAQALETYLQEHGRRVTLLDGDIVRNNISKGLGFSKEDRVMNITRVGYIASQVVYHDGVAICALISPYTAARDQVRTQFSPGQFVEVYVSTPLEVCEARDSKGLYAKARRGKMSGLTGVDDSYEAPVHPEITIDTAQLTVDESVETIVTFLQKQSFLR